MSEPESENVVTLAGEDVRKADTKALITTGADAFPEDPFENQYWTGLVTEGPVVVIEPLYKPGTLHAKASQNNILLQCIEAMEVNIDGTGHSIDLIDESFPESKAEKETLECFFKEPYPGRSMISIRRDMRRDLESTGNGYLEAIRSADDEVVMLNWLESHDMRLIRLDAPVPAEKVLMRKGKELKVTISVRERRFVQMVNGKKLYFKVFGSKRDLNRETGEWATTSTRLPVDKRASEILHIFGNREPKTPYGTPRWINQLPSVLGSRKAEEFNLEFFDGGGIPPVLVLIEGGTMGAEVRNELRLHLSGKGNKHRAAIVEAVSTSGSIDSSGQVRVRVERFGSERQNDAMFMNYDASSIEHIRVGFRLPPMFLGKSGDMNFATAYTSYMVAEAQVFFPERDAFDALINNTIVPALGVKNYKFRSLPLTLVDVANQLKAIEIAIDAKLLAGDETVSKLNEITGLSMEFDQEGADAAKKQAEDDKRKADEAAAASAAATATPVNPAQGAPGRSVGDLAPNGGPMANPDPQQTGGASAPTKKAEVSLRLEGLASELVQALGLEGDDAAGLYSFTEKDRILKDVAELTELETDQLNALLAARCLKSVSVDPEGLAELCGCAAHLGLDHD